MTQTKGMFKVVTCFLNSSRHPRKYKRSFQVSIYKKQLFLCVQYREVCKVTVKIQSLFNLSSSFSSKGLSATVLFYSNYAVFTKGTKVERGTHHFKRNVACGNLPINQKQESFPSKKANCSVLLSMCSHL